MAAAEQKKSYQVVKQFKGLDTKANRTAIDETEFSWIENAQPIGYANLKVVPNSLQVFDGSNNAVTFTSTNYLNSINLNITDYVVSFNSDGSAQFYNVNTNTTGTIASAGKFSNSGISVCQWNNQYMMILDPEKGLFSWDGTNVVTVGSIGVVAITNPGTGYTLPPLVTISAPNDTNGIQANAVTTLVQGGNSVGGIFTLTGGSGYTSAPTVTLTSVNGAGSGATAIAGILTFANSTVTVNVVDGGAGYSSTPLITISGGGGTGAVGNAVVSGNTVTQVIMTNPGSGYSNQANLTVSITGGGASKNAVVTATINNTPNIAVQTFSGRVWVAQGRTVYFSAAGSFSEFTSVSAGSVTLVDSTLHGNIQQLLSANNFLYIFGDDSINVFSDVRVQSNGTTLFTNTNVSASVGSRRAEAIFPYFRSVLFMNDYGIYALVGSTTSKLSDPLDGVFPNIDFASPIYAGQVLINNILCAAFNFKYYDSQFTGTYRYIQAVYFEKKWFITSQDDNMAYITSVPVAGKIALFGTSSNNLYKLYSTGASNNITSRVQTALMPMGDPIRTKQALKVAIEATNYNAPVNLTATVDSESISESLNSLSSLIYWTNIYGTTISWLNNSNSVIGWDASGYQLFKSDASNYGKYLGCTVTSNSGGFIYNGFEFEHELRVRF
jgi:hypothetical protein